MSRAGARAAPGTPTLPMSPAFHGAGSAQVGCGAGVAAARLGDGAPRARAPRRRAAAAGRGAASRTDRSGWSVIRVFMKPFCSTGSDGSPAVRRCTEHTETHMRPPSGPCDRFHRRVVTCVTASAPLMSYTVLNAAPFHLLIPWSLSPGPGHQRRCPALTCLFRAAGYHGDMTRPALHLPFLFPAPRSPVPALAQTPPDAFQSHLRAGQTALRAGLPLAGRPRVPGRRPAAPRRRRRALRPGGRAGGGGPRGGGEAEYRQTIALRPDNAPAHNALAGLLEDRGDEAAALAQYRQAVALLPSDPRLRFNLAAALADAGQPRPGGGPVPGGAALEAGLRRGGAQALRRAAGSRRRSPGQQRALHAPG